MKTCRYIKRNTWHNWTQKWSGRYISVPGTRGVDKGLLSFNVSVASPCNIDRM